VLLSSESRSSPAPDRDDWVSSRTGVWSTVALTLANRALRKRAASRCRGVCQLPAADSVSTRAVARGSKAP
jgi:hypothetical protein